MFTGWIIHLQVGRKKLRKLHTNKADDFDISERAEKAGISSKTNWQQAHENKKQIDIKMSIMQTGYARIRKL